MSLPKVGMHYQDVEKRVKRIARSPMDSVSKQRLTESLINQAARHEGQKAAKELKYMLSKERR